MKLMSSLGRDAKLVTYRGPRQSLFPKAQDDGAAAVISCVPFATRWAELFVAHKSSLPRPNELRQHLRVDISVNHPVLNKSWSISMKSSLPMILTAAATITCAAIILLTMVVKSHGQTVMLRSACDMDRLDGLKGGYWRPMP